jgi:hypothetical protein
MNEKVSTRELDDSEIADVDDDVVEIRYVVPL